MASAGNKGPGMRFYPPTLPRRGGPRRALSATIFTTRCCCGICREPTSPPISSQGWQPVTRSIRTTTCAGSCICAKALPGTMAANFLPTMSSGISRCALSGRRPISLTQQFTYTRALLTNVEIGLQGRRLHRRLRQQFRRVAVPLHAQLRADDQPVPGERSELRLAAIRAAPVRHRPLQIRPVRTA